MAQIERTQMKIVRKLILKVFPDIVYDEATSLKAIKNLNKQLQREKQNSKEWRDRALETERFIRLVKNKREEMAREFDREGKTNLFMKV
jgi:hypothetical protein